METGTINFNETIEVMGKSQKQNNNHFHKSTLRKLEFVRLIHQLLTNYLNYIGLHYASHRSS